MNENQIFQKEDFERACILYTIRGRLKCPKCGSPLVEVMRDFGLYEIHCLRFSIDKERCNFLKTFTLKNNKWIEDKY